MYTNKTRYGNRSLDKDRPNYEIKKYAADRGISLSSIANALNISPTTFYNKMHKELSDDLKNKIINIVDKAYNAKMDIVADNIRFLEEEKREELSNLIFGMREYI